MNECFTCVYVCVSCVPGVSIQASVLIRYLWKPGEDMGSSGTRVTDGCELMGIFPSPQEEQPVPLAAESSLQPPLLRYFTVIQSRLTPCTGFLAFLLAVDRSAHLLCHTSSNILYNRTSGLFPAFQNTVTIIKKILQISWSVTESSVDQVS